MKKALHILSFAALALAALASCAKEEFKENVIPAGEQIEVSLNGLIGEFTPADATKATAESVVRVTWGSGDKVYVYDGSNASIGTLTITPDNNNASYAMLSGTITASSASPSKLTLVYVKGANEAPAIAGGKISVDLSSQNQTEVPFVLYTTVAYDADALTKTNEYISFTFATSVMTVNCTGLQTGASGAVTGIDKAEIDGVSTACELTIDGTGVTAVAGITPGKITRTEITGTGASVFQQSDSRGAFRLALAADPAAPASRNILVFQGSKVSGAAFTTTTLAGGKSYNTVYQMGEYISNEPDGMLSGEFTVSDPDGIPNSGDETKVHFSKGNLWYGKVGLAQAATFQFEGKQYEFHTYDSTNDLWGFFGWVGTSSTVFTSVPGIYGVSTSATRSDYGNVAGESLKADWGKTIGDGNTWRTLTQKEWEYLFDEHSYKWVSVNDVAGYVIAPDQVTLSEGKTSYTEAELNDANLVFLPAAGYRGDITTWDSSIDIDGIGTEGRYWSSSSNENNESNADFAKFVIFDNSFVGATAGYNYPRNYGHSVRLVTESSGDYAPAVKVTGVTLSKSKTTIDLGDSEILVANVLPANAANKQINWLSSNTSVATVDQNGKVTGVAVGSAVITATTADGNFTAVCIVTVVRLSLPGEFTINSDGDKIHFAKGNLYCSRTSSSSNDWTWHFYDEQYQYNSIPLNSGSDSDRTATATDSEIDLFTWGYNATKSIDPVGTDYVSGHATDGETFSKSEDWGYVFGGESSVWRTLTKDEWTYLFNTRTMTNGKARCSNAVSGVVIGGTTYKGVFLYPDNYNGDIVSASMTWDQINAAGIVFLPAAGNRNGSNVRNVGISGFYWSSSAYNSNSTYSVSFDFLVVSTESPGDRNFGYSVRLVTECQ